MASQWQVKAVRSDNGAIMTFGLAAAGPLEAMEIAASRMPRCEWDIAVEELRLRWEATRAAR